MYKIKLFLFGVINLFIFQTYGQSKVVTLELKNFNIEINGNRYDMDSIISEKIFFVQEN